MIKNKLNIVFLVLLIFGATSNGYADGDRQNIGTQLPLVKLLVGLLVNMMVSSGPHNNGNQSQETVSIADLHNAIQNNDLLKVLLTLGQLKMNWKNLGDFFLSVRPSINLLGDPNFDLMTNLFAQINHQTTNELMGAFANHLKNLGLEKPTPENSEARNRQIQYLTVGAQTLINLFQQDHLEMFECADFKYVLNILSDLSEIIKISFTPLDQLANYEAI